MIVVDLTDFFSFGKKGGFLAKRRLGTRRQRRVTKTTKLGLSLFKFLEAVQIIEVHLRYLR